MIRHTTSDFRCTTLSTPVSRWSATTSFQSLAFYSGISACIERYQPGPNEWSDPVRMRRSTWSQSRAPFQIIQGRVMSLTTLQNTRSTRAGTVPIWPALEQDKQLQPTKSRTTSVNYLLGSRKVRSQLRTVSTIIIQQMENIIATQSEDVKRTVQRWRSQFMSAWQSPRQDAEIAVWTTGNTCTMFTEVIREFKPARQDLVRSIIRAINSWKTKKAMQNWDRIISDVLRRRNLENNPCTQIRLIGLTRWLEYPCTLSSTVHWHRLRTFASRLPTIPASPSIRSTVDAAYQANRPRATFHARVRNLTIWRGYRNITQAWCTAERRRSSWFSSLANCWSFVHHTSLPDWSPSAAGLVSEWRSTRPCSGWAGEFLWSIHSCSLSSVRISKNTVKSFSNELFGFWPARRGDKVRMPG